MYASEHGIQHNRINFGQLTNKANKTQEELKQRRIEPMLQSSIRVVSVYQLNDFGILENHDELGKTQLFT
jgi:hypothetical protein